MHFLPRGNIEPSIVLGYTKEKSFHKLKNESSHFHDQTEILIYVDIYIYSNCLMIQPGSHLS